MKVMCAFHLIKRMDCWIKLTSGTWVILSFIWPLLVEVQKLCLMQSRSTCFQKFVSWIRKRDFWSAASLDAAGLESFRNSIPRYSKPKCHLLSEPNWTSGILFCEMTSNSLNWNRLMSNYVVIHFNVMYWFWSLFYYRR